MLDVLVVSLCKPVIHKLKILVGGIGSDQILNVSGGKQKGGRGGGAQFLTQIYWRENHGGNYDKVPVTTTEHILQ